MIDTFALALSHGLLLLVAWRFVRRPDAEEKAVPVRAAKDEGGAGA